ncbi:MarR family transcriptional regulator [Oceanithermus sp.]|uniref:MarR family transcriptional regulator n=1 Tax=Oceanithermus profundus TaxID=187137 RepID=A0A7C4VCC5_9DEIN|nr:MarR family transcriptional regulator [Oceanithermus sp.]HGY08863.1 MarR family transcriptional regulator [Oceanithermus profundus]
MDPDRRQLLAQLDEEFFLFLWRVKESTARLFKPLGLRPEQVFILELIDRGLHHPKEIADALQWDPPLLSHYLAKLEERRLIERELDPDDRRRTRITLSASGARRLERARAAWRDYTAETLEVLDPGEIETLRGYLRRLLAAQEARA